MTKDETPATAPSEQQRRKRAYIIYILGILFIPALACFFAVVTPSPEELNSGTWRYRMTVTVETPEGLKTGSAVREVHAEVGPKLWSEGSSSIDLKGEAVVVDLGNRGKLFASISRDYGWQIVFDAFPTKYAPLTREGIQYYNHLKKTQAVLTPKQYPIFVHFKDINDPKTIQEVRSVETYDQTKKDFPDIDMVRFGTAFGEGVELKQVTVEMTDAPITWGIEKELPWLLGRLHKGGYLGGSTQDTSNDPSGLHIQGDSFIEGKY